MYIACRCSLGCCWHYLPGHTLGLRSACCLRRPPPTPRAFSAELPTSSPGSPQPVVGLLLPKCRALQLLLLNFIGSLLAHSSSMSISLDDSPALKYVDWSTQFAVTCKHRESVVHYLYKLIDTDVKHKQDSFL